MNYLEIIEELTEEELETRQAQKIILEVADEDDAREQYDTILADPKIKTDFPHTAKMHGHEHKADKSKNTPCVLCDLKQPKKNDIIEE
jgi:hypothetical protein